MKRQNAFTWILCTVLLGLSGVVAQAATITLSGNVVTYTAAPGVNNAISLTIVGGAEFVFNDTAETITTDIVGATGSGTNTVTVPITDVTGVALLLDNGADTIATSGVVLDVQSMTISQTGTTLTVSGPLTTLTGNIIVSTSNTLAINNHVNAGNGTITLRANQDGAGTQSLTQNATAATSSISTTSASASAVSIQVNSSTSGTGNASLRSVIVTSGTLNVQTFGGSILFAGTDALSTAQAAQSTLSTLSPVTGPLSGGSAPSGTINARTYLLSTSPGGAGSIGTAARPIQTAVPATNGVTLTAGSGGAYLVDWGSPVVLNGASASGAGNVVVVAANVGGHNLTVTGNVSTVSGNIALIADDDFAINAAATIGGAACSGNVYMACNRDNGNSENLTMSGSVVTSSTAAGAVVFEAYHTAGNGTNGGNQLTVNNITVGDGGTIILSTVPSNQATGQGSIFASSAASLLNAGPNGTVRFIATTMAGNPNVVTSVGSPGIPMKVTAGNVVVTALVGTSGVLSTPAASVYVTDTIGANFTASIGGSVASSLNLTTSAGILTLSGVTNNSTPGGMINLTGAGGVVINAPLGSANTGNILINGNPATLNTTFSPNSTQTVSVTAPTGLTVSSTGVLAGTAAPGNFTTVSVESGGTLSPAGANIVGTLNIGSVVIPAGGIVRADLNGDASFDSLNVTGTINVTGATLALLVSGTITTGTAYTLVANDGVDPVVGQFAGGTTIVAANDLRHTFAINYAGGDGNDIVATVTVNPNSVLDVTNGVVAFQSTPGINNVVTVSQAAGNYTFADTATTFSLTANAVAAGWTGNGTNTVTGPVLGVTDLVLNLSDGTDSITGAVGGTANVSVNATGALNVAGSITTTGNISVTGVTDLSVTGATTTLECATLNLTTTNSIGGSSQPIATKAAAIVAKAGAGGVFLTEADGASLTATATGAGNIAVVNTAGLLNISAATTTVTGNISLSSGDALTLGANVNAGSGTITLAANTNGAGAEGYDQKAAVLTTTNTTIDALSITVNTAAGGTGDAVIGMGSIGSATGSNATINSHGGSILWSADPFYTAFGNAQTGVANAGSNTQTLRARVYSFNTASAGVGGVGTAARPIQIDNFGPDVVASPPTLTASAGSGGVYVVGWDQNGNDLTTGNISATGAGNILIVAANSGGHNLFVRGNLSTGSGTIFLAADDNFDVGPDVVMGGAGFSGTVFLTGNRDRGTAGQPLTMDATSSIVTSSIVNNPTALNVLRTPADQAVYVDTSGDAGTPSPITLGSITTGDGGRIVINATPRAYLTTGAEADAGRILMAGGTNVLDAGPAGTVELVGRISAAASADAIGSAASPVAVRAGNIVVHSNYGNVYVSDSIAATITSATLVINTDGATGQTGTAALNFTTTGGTLTVSNAIANVTGGAINLNGAGGVILNAVLGSGATGPISITGGLSGTANIVTGVGNVTIAQDSATVYDGVISGANALTKSGIGTLTLTGVNTYAGTTTINGGGLTINGSIATSATAVASGGAISGSGAVTALAVGGQVSPGTFGTNGNLTSGNLAFDVGGTLVADLTNKTTPGTTYDQLSVIGAVDLTNSTLRLIIPATGINLTDSFTLIANDGADPTVGQFAGGTSIQAFNNPLYFFTINYAGGDGNDVTATLSTIAASGILNVAGGVVSYSAGPGVNNTLNVDINAAKYVVGDTANAIILTPGAVAAGWTVTGGIASGPTLNVTTLTFNLNDGTDAFTLLNAGSANVNVNATGALALNGNVTTTGVFAASQMSTVAGSGPIYAGTVTFDGASNAPLTFGALSVATGSVTITDNNIVTFNGVFAAPSSPVTLTGAASVVSGANGKLEATSITLDAANGIGTSTKSIATQAAAIVANGGTGGVYITEADGADLTVTAAGAGNVSVATISGPLNVAGPSTSVNGTLSLSSASGVLTTLAPISTAGGAISLTSLGSMTVGATVSSGSGALSLTSGTGVAVNGALSTTSGNITVANTSGLLATSATLTTGTGDVSLSSGDEIGLGANLNAGGGTITIAANTDGAGGQGYNQANAILTSTNTTATALTLTVNTAAGGTGDAFIGQGNIGSAAGGTITMNSNGGNIFWSDDPSYMLFTPSQTGLGNGGSSTQTLRARVFSFTSSGGGGLGKDDRPLQIDNFGPDLVAPIPTLTASAGSGGIYITAWDQNGNNDLTIGSIKATGAGNVRIAAANAVGHNLQVRGNVSTGSGYIYLAADDNLDVGPGVVIGGPGFSGNVWMSGNRDVATVGQPVVFDTTASIVTASTANQVVPLADRTPATQAVYMEIGGGTAAGVGIITIGNITVGDGGRVVLNGGNLLNPGQAGTIRMAAATNVINAGPTGTVELDAILAATAGADNIGSTAIPIVVTGGNVVVNSQFGNVWVTGTAATNFAANFTSISGQNTGPSLNLVTTAGKLTINGATSIVNGGAINLTGAAGIDINAPLSGSGNGTINLNAGATNPANLNSVLTVADNQALNITSSGGLNVGATGVLAGSGAAANNYTVAGQAGATVSPGATLGILKTGNLNMAGGLFLVDLNGTSPGANYDQVNVAGTVTISGATLTATLGGGYIPLVNDALTILNNDLADPIVGQFAGLPEGSFTTVGGQFFRITYTGGDGNDIVLTRDNPSISFYVDDAFTGFTNGQAIVDADPVAVGDQGATFGTNAFASINAAIAAIPTGGLVVVNAGTYNEAVVLNKPNSVIFQEGGSTVASLAGTVSTAPVSLNGITLTVGADNSSTAVAGPIGGSGGLIKTGTGTLTLNAVNTYNGATAVNGGTLRVAPGASLASACTVNNSARMIVDGTAASVQPTASTVATPAAGGSLLRGSGTAGVVTFNDTTNANAAIWPGTAALVSTLNTNESTTPLTVNSVNFTNGGKFATVLKHNGGSPRWQRLVVTNGCTIPATNAVLSFATEPGTFAVPSAAASYLVISNTGKTINTTFPNVIAPPGAVLGTHFDIKYVDSAVPAVNTVLQSALGGGKTMSFLADQVYVVFTGVSAGVTPVKLDSFTATPEGPGVLLAWHSVSEFQNAGYHVYRRAAGTDGWSRVNNTLIAGRVTSADEHTYRLYDWAANGLYEYRLESVSIDGALEDYPSIAGPVSLDAASGLASVIMPSAEGMVAACGALESSAKAQRVRDLSVKFAALSGAKSELQNTSAAALNSKAEVQNEVASASVRELGSSAEAAPASVASRAAAPGSAFSAAAAGRAVRLPSRTASGSSFTAAKVQYVQPGVLAIPQAALPAGFNVHRVTILREGRAVPILAVRNDTLYVYAPGYSDDYTSTDALFVRSTSAPTVAGAITKATGLFGSPGASTDTSASVTASYHDVYFDYDAAFRPYTFSPWFSNKYLTDGSAQSFTLDTPFAGAASASLTVTLWSLTGTGAGTAVDHALPVVINDQLAGQVQWSGGQKMMQLVFQVPAGVLKAGTNRIELVTPALPGVSSQISFLHSLTMSYTRTLDASHPVTAINGGVGTKVFEVANLPSADAWIVDARYPDRAALVPFEAVAQADGTYRVRFNAAGGGSGQYLVVPFGRENQPASVAKCSVKPVSSVKYLAVGPKQFAQGVQPLVAKHQKDGLRGAFVDQEQIFNYYNYGRYGPAGIQKAVRSVRPQYLLLVGRTTYDYHNYSGANADPLCPAFLVSTSYWAQTTSDSMFADMGRGYPEAAVGRLPVSNTAELACAVKHILSQSGAQDSGIRIHAVADRADPAAGDFAAQATALAESLPEMSWQQNYYGVTHQTLPEVTAAMTAAANGGADWIVYIGHGNASHLGQGNETILDTASVRAWTGNVVFLQATCTGNWMAKAEQDYKSVAMQALTQPQGGISASVGTSTYMNSDCAVAFMKQLMTNADARGMRWGDALMKSQQWAFKQGGSINLDLSNTEQLFGDPAMPVFSRPKQNSGSGTGGGTNPSVPNTSGTF